MFKGRQFDQSVILLCVFGKEAIAMLVADREFIGAQWFDFLVETDIPSVIRVKQNQTVVLAGGSRTSVATLFSRRLWRNRETCRGAALRRHETAIGRASRAGRKDHQEGLAAGAPDQSRSATGRRPLQAALADRMPLRRNQDARPQSRRHSHDQPAKAVPAGRYRRFGHRMRATRGP
jgi:hypothetical protein